MNTNLQKKSFGGIAQLYQKYRKPYPRGLFDALGKILIDKKNLIMLDIGCGTGKSTEPIAKNGVKIVGVDHDVRMLKEARLSARKKNLPIRYIKAAASKLPFRSQSFDVVISGAAFHWFADNKSLKELRRVLKENGLIFIFWTRDKKMPQRDQIDYSIYQKYKWKFINPAINNGKEIASFLKEAGFRDVKIKNIPLIETYSVSEYVGLMKTAAQYPLMKEDGREGFEKDLKEMLTKKIGKRKKFVINQSIKIVYATK